MKSTQSEHSSEKYEGPLYDKLSPKSVVEVLNLGAGGAINGYLAKSLTGSKAGQLCGQLTPPARLNYCLLSKVLIILLHC